MDSVPSVERQQSAENVFESAPVVNVEETASKQESPHALEKAPADIVEERVGRIMNLLKNVNSQRPSSATSRSDLASVRPLTPMNTMSNSPSTSMMFHQPHTPPVDRTKIIRLECDLQEKSRMILAMKTEIVRLKDKFENDRREMQLEHSSKASLQRTHFETLIKRTQASLDKTLAEKEDIYAKFQSITEEFQKVEKKFKDKLQFMEESHAKELKRRKELWETAEKMKRERWLQERSKQIKEQTMKGFEPEIQRLISSHKTQIEKVEQESKACWHKEKQSLIKEHQAELEKYREKLADERRKAADEERELARQKYQRQAERDEIEQQQQKRKLTAQFAEEKDRLLVAWKEEKKVEIEAWRVKLEDAVRQLTEAKSSYVAETERLLRSHALEMTRLRHQLSQDGEEWKEKFAKHLQKEQAKKEEELVKKLISERDEEIDRVIKSLESETFSSSKDLNSEHHAEITKLQSEHKEEMRMLQTQLNSSIEKIMNYEEVIHREEQEVKGVRRDLIKLKTELDTKNSMIDEQKKELQRLRVQRSDMRNVIEKELERDTNSSQIKIKALEKALSDKSQALELAIKEGESKRSKILETKAQELERLEQHVQEALAQKEWENRQLADELDNVRQHNEQMQIILEEQRQKIVENIY
eukprot:Partr_v1_DN27093_c0_g1_i1_m28776 putative 5-azacytidine induced 1